jgi:LPS sulfotransferase NodH
LWHGTAYASFRPANRRERQVAIRQYVFIVTYARSGSTLLQSLIGSLPGTHMAGENLNALFWLYRSWRAVKQSRHQHGLREMAPNEPWYGADKLEPRPFGNALARNFIQHVLRPLPESKRVGFKEIRWFDAPNHFSPYMHFLRSFFAPARIVFNSRDAEQVSRSAWFAKQDSAKVIAKVRAADAMMKNYARQNPSDCIHLHYNDYVADPSRLNALFEFLGARMPAKKLKQILSVRLTHCQIPSEAEAAGPA